MRVILLFVLLLVRSSGASATPHAERRETSPLRKWRLAYVQKGDLWTANGDGSNRLLLVKNGSAPCWSPDHKQIAFVRDGDIWLVRLRDRNLRRLTTGWKGPRDGPGYSGGKEVTITWDSVSGNLYVAHWEDFLIRRPGDRSARAIPVCSIFELSPKGGKPIPRWDLLDDEARFRTTVNNHPAFSSDGKFMAFVRNGDVWLAERIKNAEGYDAYRRRWVPWDVRRLKAAAHCDAPNWRGSRQNHYAVGVAISPRGTHIAYTTARVNGSGSWSLTRLDMMSEKGFTTVVRSVDIDGGFNPTFSPDGRWIASENRPSQDWGIWASTLDGKNQRLLIPDGEEPAW